MITKLKLKNFRQFKEKELELKKETVLIIGDNTKGKSTILESIYTILNGSSPWGNSFDELVNKEEKYFSINIELQDENKLTLYQEEKIKRYLLDKKRTSKKKFLSYLKANIFSPEQIEFLMYLSQKRRDFLDNLISEIDIEYKENLNLYKRVLRQRNSYLKKLAKAFFEKGILNENDKQIEYWDKQMAKLGGEISIKRIEIINKLKNNDFKIEYKPSIKLNTFDEMLNSEDIERIFLEEINKNFKKDVVTGYSNTGTHRDDWEIYSNKDNLKKFGSRGEKRLGIANLILETQEIYKEYLGKYPILLLDDISAELDDKNSDKIFANKIIKKQQVFITSTKRDNISKEILKNSQIIQL